MEQQVMSQVVLAYLVAQIIQWAKKATALPWITDKTDDVARVASATLAFLASVGITVSFDKEAGTLLVTGLSLSGALSMLWLWVQQVVLQQLIYRGSMKVTPKDQPLCDAVADLKRIGRG